MPGRHAQSAVRRGGLRWLAGAGALVVASATMLGVSPANAATTTVNAHLSLSGVATKDNVAGGSVVGIHPGDKINFKAAGVPTAGFEQLGLGGLVDGLLRGLGTFQVTADFSGLPGGAKGTVLKGSTAKSFSFPSKGTYNFTWSAQNVTILGVVPINLDGNQLKNAGIKLNASNQYIGQIVVADHPPAGGISIQLPGVKVAPSLPVVGQLPTLGIPRVTVPKGLPSLGNLLPKPGTKSTTPKKTKAATKPTAGIPYKLPGLSIPEQVVPQGTGFGGGGAGGYFPGVLPNTGSQTGNLSPLQSGNAAAKAPGLAGQNSTGKNKTVDLASSSKSSSGQLPVILAILAIIALALVAGTYARLFLLRRNP